MEKIEKQIIDNKNNKKIIFSIFYTILEKILKNEFFYANAIKIFNIMYINNIDIIAEINLCELKIMLEKTDQKIIYGYFFILYNLKEKQKNINEIIIFFNKYKKDSEPIISYDNIYLYIKKYIMSYINSNFEEKFIYSLNNPLKNSEWEEIHKNEIIIRLNNVMKMFNNNIAKMCNIKKKHITTINNMSFDELSTYFCYCYILITNKIKIINDEIIEYNKFNVGLNKLIEHNEQYITNDNVVDIDIFENIDKFDNIDNINNIIH